MDKKVKTVGFKEGLGAGIVGLGLIYFFLPSMIQKIADLDFIQSEPFAMLSGTVLVLAVFTVAAGLVVMLANLNEE
ncbi:MAG: hypothetical protein HPY72_03810 [Anaerolineae bacterium]|jgi:hypothetical protein|nr:hypothetical protein [Anaerolineae bacterium]